MRNRFWRRLRSLWHRRQLDRDLDDELRFHLEMLAGQRADARRQFGNLAHLKETCRNMWTLPSLEDWIQDFRFSARTLAKSPGFSSVAIAVLALGIGANATVFTLVNALLFKNLPFAESDRVLYLSTGARGRGGAVSYPDYLDYRSQLRSFTGLGAYSRTGCSLSDATGVPESYYCTRVTANAFGVLGLKPVAGRDFLPEDEKAGAPGVAIITYGVWESRYGKDPAAVGRPIRVNSVPAIIVGVMPRGINFPGETDVYILIDAPQQRDLRVMVAFGRLAPGATKSTAQAEVEGVAHNLARAYPATNKDLAGFLMSYNELAIKKNIRMVFYVLLGAVGFVLLIACCNVANLLLARAIGRSREITIRAALGATRWRVVRQLLAESVMLASAGGTLGCFLAVWGARAFDAAVIPTGKPVWIDFSLDYRVLAYVAAVSIATGILFGLVPALRLSRTDLQSVLKDGGRGSSTGMRGRYLAGALVVTEMALAVVLLTGAGVMIRSFLKAYTTPIGINPANVLALRIELPGERYTSPQLQLAFFDRLKEQLLALPGVKSVTALSRLPGEGASYFPKYEVEGTPVDAAQGPSAGTLFISPEYFSTMDAPVKSGRAFLASDQASSAPVVIVNESFAARSWPGEKALGKRLRLTGEAGPEPWLTVVGVAPNISQGRSSRPDPLLYVPYQKTMRFSFCVAARTAVPPESLGDAFRRAVQRADVDMPVRELTTLDAFLRLQGWEVRIFGSMFAIFGGIAFVIASVGLYAVVAHSVNQRTHEIGVRIAMGAPTSRVLRMVFAQGLRQLAIGLAIGLGAAWGITGVLRSLVENVSPRDPVTFGAVTLALVAAGALGCAIPARRAVRVDPAITLRHD